MLKAIRKLDKKRREGVLAELILSRGAPVENAIGSTSEDLRTMHEEILKEVASTLRVDPSDNSPDARRKFSSFLTRELRELTFDKDKVAESRNRLGHEGLLPSALYDVEFMYDFSEFVETLGVTRDEVRNAIAAPSLSEHYMPEQYAHVDLHAVSLFAKVVRADDPYTLVIDCQRVGAKIQVHYALRMFHSDIDLSRCATVIDMLSTFANKYGVDIVAGEVKKRFMFYEAVSAPPTQAAQELMSWENKEGQFVDSRCTFKRTPEGWIIALGYAVDLTAYVSDLLKHGVQIRRKFSNDERFSLAA